MAGKSRYTADFVRAAVARAAALGEHGIATVARELGISHITVWRWKTALEKQGAVQPPPVPPLPEMPDESELPKPPGESVEVCEEGDTRKVTLQRTPLRNPEDVMRHCGLDPAEWETVTFTWKNYQMGSVPRSVGSDREGWSRESTEPVVTDLYSVKAVFRYKRRVVDARAEIEALLAHAREHVAAPVIVPARAFEGGLLFGFGPIDHHFGMRAWPAETGEAAYDLEIAADEYRRAIRTLVERAGGRTYERGLLVVGHDALHVDSGANTTTKGTPQDVDGRYAKVFRTAWQTISGEIVWYVENVGPLRVIIVPGNHDRVSSLLLGEVIEARFHGYPHVEVDTSPALRKYVEWGVNLLGFTHGDDVTPDKLYRLMADHEAWGRTLYREWFTGHIHTRKAFQDEINGVRVRSGPTLAPATAWASSRGLVGNVRSSEAYVWDKQEGPVLTVAHNIPRRPGLQEF